MPYVAKDPDSYVGKPHVGNGECVARVEAATGAPMAFTWRQGAAVKGNLALARGTAIATFDATGLYANKPHGNHAAIYLGQNLVGIQVIDQWHGKEPHTRTIFFGHKGASNDGSGFSVSSSIVLAWCLMAPALASARAADVSCPTYESGSRLTSFDVFDSYPKRNASLRGDDGPAGGMWDLRAPAVYPSEGYYVVCNYTQGGKLTLKLPAVVKSCRMAGSSFIPNVTCR